MFTINYDVITGEIIRKVVSFKSPLDNPNFYTLATEQRLDQSFSIDLLFTED